MESQVLKKEVSSRAVPAEAPSAPVRVLPSGRSVVLKIGDGCEDLEVRSPAGDVEVRISLTDQGAVVSLRGGQLQMESADAVTLNCRRLEVVKARAEADPGGGGKFQPGAVIEIAKESFVVGCGAETRLRITAVQLEGKRSMPARDFLNGSTLRVGGEFGG